MKKLILLFGAVSIAILLFAIHTTTETTNTATIGFFTDLSGPAAPYGEEILRGAKLAAQGYENILIRYEDTQCNPREGITILQQLRTAHDIRVTGGTVCSSVAQAIAPLLEGQDMFHLSTGASSPELTHAGERFFRVWPSDAAEARILATYAIKEIGVETASILYVDTEFSRPLQEIFRQYIQEHEKKILSTESFSSEARDVRAQLIRIQQEKPDAIYVISHPEQIPIILRQIKELGIESKILSYGPAIQAHGILEQSGIRAEGVTFAFPKQEESQTFKERYRTQYGTEPGLGASVGYDTMKLLIEAVEQCGDRNITCIQRYLHAQQERPSASGTISFDENGDVVVPAVIMHIRDGKAEEIQREK